MENPETDPDMFVELNLAFMWDCPECGNENFQRGITIFPKEMPELFEDAALGQVMLTKPKHVTCRVCSKSFDVLPSLPGE